MILINPIKINNYKQTSANYQSRPVFVQKADAFEIKSKNPSFGSNINLHFPVKETEKLFAKVYKEIKSTIVFDEKVELTDKCLRQFREIIDSVSHPYEVLEKERYAFTGSRSHQILAPFSEFYGFYNRTIKLNQKPSNDVYDNYFKYITDRTIKSIKTYEVFLSKGLNEMKPKDIFKLALDSVSEKAKHDKIKIKVIGGDLLNDSQIEDGDITGFNLYGLFSGLIQNSVKYSPNNSNITISFEKQRIKNRNYLAFSVSDQGRGISKEKQEKLFNFESIDFDNIVKEGIPNTGFGSWEIMKTLKKAGCPQPIIKSPLSESNKDFPETKIICLLK